MRIEDFGEPFSGMGQIKHEQGVSCKKCGFLYQKVTQVFDHFKERV